MTISTPYLLYLGSSTDPLAVKTARGVAYWKPESCIGQMREDGCTVSLGLEELSFQEARGKGAKTFLIGVANGEGSCRGKPSMQPSPRSARAWT